MSQTEISHSADAGSGGRLAGSFVRWALAALAVVLVLWILGFEAIVYHPTPFYALFRPAFDSPWPLGVALLGAWIAWFGLTRTVPGARFPWMAGVGSLVCGAVFCVVLASLSPGEGKLLPEWGKETLYFLFPVLIFGAFFGLLLTALPAMGWLEAEPSRRSVQRILTASVVFLFIFAGSVAMMRGGTEGIAQAYMRQDHEYIGDIGSGLSIHGLFRDYAKLHPHLSMHAKVHPPGPIVMLWILSFVAGRDPMSLSIATMVVGALAVVPLYLWTSQMCGRRVGLSAVFLYCLVPSIVLFTATSADVLFMPMTLFALYFFWRAVHERSVIFGVSAGLLYGCMALTSYSLIGIGAFFGLVGLWRLLEPRYRIGVIQTAVIMGAMVLLLHGAVYWWSGYNPIDVFHLSKAQFDADQVHLDEVTPRFAAIWFRLVNPFCWLLFAGIPVSVLALRRLFRGERDSRALFVVIGLTLLVLDLLYLARGEGERSAMYVMPFLIIPAAYLLESTGRRAGSYVPLAATLGLMALQTWLMELLLYTYW